MRQGREELSHLLLAPYRTADSDTCRTNLFMMDGLLFAGFQRRQSVSAQTSTALDLRSQIPGTPFPTLALAVTADVAFIMSHPDAGAMPSRWGNDCVAHVVLA